MFRREKVCATDMPADTSGFSFFCVCKFAAMKKHLFLSRKVVNGETETSGSNQRITIGPKNLTAAL